MMRRKRKAALPSDAERIASLAQDSGEPVEEFLRVVADFRLALETDLLIAAAATDYERVDLAVEAVESSTEQLHAFQDRLLDRLAEAPPPGGMVRLADVVPIDSPRRRRRVGASPVVAAAAAALAFVVGGGGFRTASPKAESAAQQAEALQAADAQLGRLARMTVREADLHKLDAVVDELHDTIEALIDQHAPGDPILAMQIAELLSEEQQLINYIEDPKVSPNVLMGKVRALAERLAKVEPKVRRQVARIVEAPPVKTDAPPSPKPSPSPSPKPSPSPSATASSSSSSSSSGSSSSGSGSGGQNESGGGSLPGVPQSGG